MERDLVVKIVALQKMQCARIAKPWTISPTCQHVNLETQHALRSRLSIVKNLQILSAGFLSLFLLVLPSFSQGKEAAICLKDGGIRRGLIVKLIPGEMVKLKTAYDEVFVIQMADISKIVIQEDATPAPKKDKPTPPTSTSVKLEKW